MKSRDGKSQRREEKKEEDHKRESLRRKKIQVREKVRKSQNTVSPMICGSRGSKSRLAKAAGAEPAGQMRDEKLHAVVTRSTFPSQKQFCETSSFFKVDNIKNEAILRDILQKCRAHGLVPMCFAIFPVHLSKLLRLPRKSDARSYEVLHLSRKIISANLKI